MTHLLTHTQEIDEILSDIIFTRYEDEFNELLKNYFINKDFNIFENYFNYFEDNDVVTNIVNDYFSSLDVNDLLKILVPLNKSFEQKITYNIIYISEKSPIIINHSPLYSYLLK